MKSQQFKNITTALKWSLGICILFLLWLTREAVIETEDWKLFDFDFKNKEGVISSYSSLLAAILSFIAIIFVLLDLFYQRHTKEQEKEDSAKAKEQEYKDNLNIIQLFTIELKKDAVDFFDSLKEYSVKEKSNPSEMNRIGFLPNTYPKLILDVDRVRFYEAIKFFEPSDNWKKLYVDLYKLVDYYDKSFNELKTKHQIHLNKKFKHSRDIAIALDLFIDEAMDIRNNIIQKCIADETETMDDPYFPLLQHFKELAFDFAKQQPTDKERLAPDFVNPVSIQKWHDTVFQPVFHQILDLWNKNGQDTYNLKSVHVKVQSLIREYSRLKQDSLDYAKHIEDYATRYFKEDSKKIIRLSEISEELGKV